MPLSRNESILVIDDEAMVLSLANSMLTRYGYSVITVSSGKEAIRLLEMWPDVKIDLMLVDLVMPEMNGIETVENIHQLRPGLPVLYFSAYPDQEGLRPVIARRVPYIAKP